MVDEFQNTYLPSDFNEHDAKIDGDLIIIGIYKLPLPCREPSAIHLLQDSFIDAVLQMLFQLFSSRKLNLNMDNDRIFRDVVTLLIEHLSCPWGFSARRSEIDTI